MLDRMEAMMDKSVYSEFSNSEDIKDYVALYRDNLFADINQGNLYATRILDCVSVLIYAQAAYESNPESMPDRCVEFLIMIASEEIAKYERNKKEQDNGN